MFPTLKSAALSTLIALGAFAAMPAQASADTLTVTFGNHGAGIHVGHRDRHHLRPVPSRGPACTPQRAVNKAARLGVRHARVRNMNRNVINVRGNDRGRPVLMTFARAPGCPVIR